MAQNKQGNAAQHQHYVPQFILRNFVHDQRKEQVNVFDKETGNTFSPSISNIMGERRFHDFVIGEQYIATFEKSAGKIEELILPSYRKVVEEQRLDGTLEQRSALALLVAFQFLRTRRQRDRFVEMEDQLKEHMGRIGGKIEDIESWKPLTEDDLKRQHADFIVSSIRKFTHLIAEKDMMLLRASENRSFYLCDDPVTLHNSEPAPDFWGNIGLGVKGIQIYMPLTSNLLLAALCPTIMGSIRADTKRQQQDLSLGLSAVMAGRVSVEAFRKLVAQVRPNDDTVAEMTKALEGGVPAPCSDDNMNFYNSLQLNFARRFVICQRNDFKLARKFMKEFGDKRREGIRFN